MCQEKKEEENFLVNKIASMHRCKDLKTTIKMQRKTDYSNQKQYRQRKHQQKNNQKIKMARNTNCMDISSDKQAKSHTRKLGQSWEKEAVREKLNIF